MVLFVFVIMLLNGDRGAHQFSKLTGFPGLLLAFARGFIAATIARSTDTVQAASQPGIGVHRDLSTMIFKDFVYPFELTSFLILVAVLGAIVLAQRAKP
jgi:NADH-quinone oxidoreductase subunit J